MFDPVFPNKEPDEGGLVDRAIRDIRMLIKTKKFRAGDVLPSETAISETLGVSRAVTREAFRALAALRILEIGNGRRARVAAPDAQATSMIIDHTVYTGQLSIQQVLDVRRTLELRTAHLAAIRRSEDQARELAQTAAAMVPAIDRPNDLMLLDIRFHEIIAQASGNDLYAILVNSFRGITEQTWHIGWRSRATLENRMGNLQCHQRLATAIVEQNADLAEALMADHFDSAMATLLSAGVT